MDAGSAVTRFPGVKFDGLENIFQTSQDGTNVLHRLLTLHIHMHERSRLA